MSAVNEEAVSTDDLLSEVPEKQGYKRTDEIAWFMGRFDTDQVLAQKWISDYGNRKDIWVVVPQFLLS